MYNFESDLAAKVAEKLAENGIDSEIKFHDVRKNNDVVLRGLVVGVDGKNVSPTIYIDKYYEKIKDGMSMEEVANEIVDIYVRTADNAPDDGIGSNITSWEYAKCRLRFKLLGKERNESFLADKVYREFLDLAIVPYIELSDCGDGVATVTVTKALADVYGVSEDEIIDLAIEQTNSFTCRSMLEVMAEMSGMDPEMLEEIGEDNTMYVLTNESKANGATAMFDKESFRRLAEKYESDIFIIPSSIHEILAIPGSKVNDADDLRTMVREVNDTQVAPEDLLSYEVYRYDAEADEIVIA